MAKKKKEHTGLGVEDIEGALTKTEQFIENNQKLLIRIVVGVLLVVGAIIGANKLYLTPQEQEAQASLFYAENYFRQDSFKLALEGDGSNYGFLDIIDNYSFTKAANLSKSYTGVSYLHLGEYEDAIEYLKDFNKKDTYMSAISTGAIGDAYVEMEKYEKGADYYMKASGLNENEFSSPIYLMKAAQVYEHVENYSKALDVYREIEENYPKSKEASNIKKYIARVELKMKK